MNCRFLKLFLNMKRLQILFFLFALLLCVPAVHAQSTMTDQQIMDFYVKSKSDGRTVAQIVTQLMERGVTVERIRKIRRNYEAQQKKEVVGADDISGQWNDCAREKRCNKHQKTNTSRSATLSRKRLRGFLLMKWKKCRIRNFAT